METVVFGKRAVEDLARAGPRLEASPASERLADRGGDAPSHAALQQLMWDSAGIERTGDGLREGLARAEAWPRDDAPTDRAGWERRQMAVLARLMLHAALRREESRGAHYRHDFPERDDAHWQRRQVFRRAD
jgi:L-aspartate oxidase